MEPMRSSNDSMPHSNGTNETI